MLLCQSKLRPFAACLMILFSALLLGQSGSDQSERPRIGLALSGGGARGFAHIGVIQALEEMGIPIDYIAGTSMGAMVGGLYATGISSLELESIMRSMDWENMTEDNPRREDRSFIRKKEAQSFLFDFELGLRDSKFIPPTGLRGGQRLNFALRRHLISAALLSDFNQLPIPFNCVATNIENGDAVVLHYGDLARAVRASMSLPGLLTPVEYDGNLLIDGGVVRNLPIDVVREMGADVVIAVDISAQLRTREQLKSPMSISSQVLGVSLRRGVEEVLPLAEVLLVPELDHNILDFNQLDQTINAGRLEVQRMAEALEPYRWAKYEDHRNMQLRSSWPDQIISSIEIQGLNRVDERILRNLITSEVGTPLDLDQLNRDLSRIYGLGDFELVEFAPVPEQGELGIIIRVVEKRWGPNYIHAGMNLTLDDDQNTEFRLKFNINRSRLNDLGLEWRTDVIVGDSQIVDSFFYQPLDFRDRYFATAGYSFTRANQNLFVDGVQAQAKGLSHNLTLSLGRNLGSYGRLQAGLQQIRVVRSLEAGELTSFEENVNLGGLFGALSFDRLDSITFPSRGGLAELVFFSNRADLNADDPFDQLTFEYVHAKSFGQHRFLSWIETGVQLSDDPPPYSLFSIGGFSSLSAYQFEELSGSRFAILRPTYLYELGRLPAVIGKGYYVGGWLEMGNVWQEDEDIRADDLRFAATLLLGVDTVAGPVYLGLGFAEKDRHSIYLAIGPTF